uniref:Uncharacterized protein n=1 Tax=Trichuris muris TaxID=70415 RepID=A0A5S6Q9U6_TRIMR
MEGRGMPSSFEARGAFGDFPASMHTASFSEEPQDAELAQVNAKKRVIKDVVTFFLVIFIIEAGARWLGKDTLPGPTIE